MNSKTDRFIKYAKLFCMQKQKTKTLVRLIITILFILSQLDSKEDTINSNTMANNKQMFG